MSTLDIPSESVEAEKAAAWAGALQYVYEEGYITRPQMEALQQSNPYRSQA